MKAAFVAALAYAALSSASDAQWTVNQQRDPITDHTEVTAELKGEGGSMVFMCTRGQSAVLVFRPAEFLGAPIARYDWRDFIFRVDDSPAVTTRWKYVDNYASAPSNNEMLRFFQAIATGRTLRVRALRYDLTTIDATFSLEGTGPAMREAVAACGGTLG